MKGTRTGMRNFPDDIGGEWTATVQEEDTPRHHGRWYLVFHRAGSDDVLLPMPEVRWQTSAGARRTLRTMSLFELRRRLAAVQVRADLVSTADATTQRGPNQVL